MASMKFLLAVTFVLMPWVFFDIVTIGTFGLTLPEACMMMVIIWTIHQVVTGKRRWYVPESPVFYMLMGVGIIVGLSAIYPLLHGSYAEIIQAIKTSLHFYSLWAFAVVCILARVTTDEWMPALRLSAIQSIGIAGYGLYQIPARAFGWPGGWIEITNANYSTKMDPLAVGGAQLALQFGDFFRATSIFSEPSALALYSTTILTIVAVPWLIGTQPVLRSRALVTTIIIMNLLALFVTFSLTGVMLLMIIVVMCLFVRPRRVLNRLLIGFVVAAIGIVAVDFKIQDDVGVSVLDLFGRRITSIVSGKAAESESEIVGESYTQRTSDYEKSYEAFLESPIVGVGPGNFSYSDAGRRHSEPYPSTTWGSVLAEQGMVGLLTYGGFMAILLLAGVRLIRERGTDADGMLSGIHVIVPVRILILIFVGLTGNHFVSNVLWIDVGLAASIILDEGRRQNRLVEHTIRIDKEGTS